MDQEKQSALQENELSTLNETPEMPSRQDDSKKRKKRRALWWYFLPVLIVAISAIIFYILSNWDSQTIKNAPNPIEDDPNARAGEIQEQINKKMKNDKFRFQINKNPVFENGNSSGNLKLVNDSANRYTETVTITLDETGEILYKSGGVRPGKAIYEFKLSRALPKGTYDCTAKIRLYKEGSGTQSGGVNAKIKITVKN